MNRSPRLSACRSLLAGGLVAVLFAATGSHCAAGIGPENVLVVVNGDSHDSRTVANHFVALREIPSRNVVVLRDVPQKSRIDLETFRSQVLQPILDAVGERQLGNQVRVVAYSADFPTRIDISPHQKRLEDDKMRRLMTPTASLTGLTFHFRHVLADNESYLSPGANLYARMPFERYFVNPFLAENAERFDAAEADAEAERHTEAAAGFAELFEKNPDHHPIAILAAQQFAAGGEPDEAIPWLGRAVDAGWTSGRYLRESETLAILRERPEFVELLSGLDEAPIDYQPAVGFTGDRIWTPSGIPSSSGAGVNYLLATMLTVTGEQGLSVDETIATLARAAEADWTHPKGSFLFTKTGDVRTTTRAKGFDAAVRHLRWQGHRAEVVPKKLPEKQAECAGVMLGAAGFRWSDCGSQLMPGALADNLTSFGGAFDGSGQTKLTELLRFGAAMSSGTVAEPYAVQLKFPHPMMHAYYASGVTSAEAFYLSVTTPYQLLIVGDPMCQPYARPPTAKLQVTRGEQAGAEGIRITWTPTESPQEADDAEIAAIEFYRNGHWVHRGELMPSYWIDLSGMDDGMHEIRTVLIASGNAAARKTVRGWFAIGDSPPPTAEPVEGKATEIKPAENGPAENEPTEGAAKELTIRVNAPGADAVVLRHHREEVGRVESEQGEIRVSASEYGSGPIRLQPIAIHGEAEVPGRPMTAPSALSSAD